MTTNNTTSNTPGNASFKDLVEADKRSILEKVLEASFPTSQSKNETPASSNGKNKSTTGMSDYDVIFGEDIDDIDELWEDIMKRAREEFKKQQELKNKYPDFDPIKDLFKKPRAPRNPRKRAVTTRAVSNSLAIMNNFKRRMSNEPEQIITNTRRMMNGSEQVVTNKPSTNSLNYYCNQYKSSAITSSKNDYNKVKSSMIPRSNPSQVEPLVIPSANIDRNQFEYSIRALMQGNQQQKTPYPIWKTTETYTPVFSVTTNPNWANLHDSDSPVPKAKKLCTPVQNKFYTKKLCTPIQNKFYTPGHINSWMDGATNSNPTEPPSCKSIRSDLAEHGSDSDEEDIKSIENTSIYFSPEYQNHVNKNSSVDCKTPVKTTVSSSTRILKNTMSSNNPTLKNTVSSNSAMKSNTVRFRPSPPEYFVYGNPSISSGSIFEKEKEINSPVDSPDNYNEFYQDSGNENCVSLQNSPLSVQTQYSPCKENIEYEEHHIYSSKTISNNIQNNTSNEPTKEPAMFVEDFVRKLNYNISNNYNMELKCSMKVKYYK